MLIQGHFSNKVAYSKDIDEPYDIYLFSKHFLCLAVPLEPIESLFEALSISETEATEDVYDWGCSALKVVVEVFAALSYSAYHLRFSLIV